MAGFCRDRVTGDYEESQSHCSTCNADGTVHQTQKN